MQNEYRFAVSALGLAALLLNAACQRTTVVPDSGAADEPDGSAIVDAAQDTGAPPIRGTNPLGAACVSASECASDFCVDGVCCEGACFDQCYSCARVGSPGSCTPVVRDEDVFASSPCADMNLCVLDASGISVCRLKDKQPCSGNNDCASGFCRTYFVDGDGDDYGVSSSYQSICDAAAAAPPSGYSALAGDCCDSDDGANPEAPGGYFTTPNACGSFDWDCNRVIERSISTCLNVGGSTAAVGCGAPCLIATAGGLPRMVTQGCR